jgi:thiamine pyrophosphate-dependent acetolactate synthase large subunit-like protein
MHFHLPKPLHGWREFVGEVAIIVLGVFIALIAEGAVEAWNWHEKVQVAESAMQQELLSDDGPQMVQRLAMHGCISSLLDQTRAAVEAGASRKQLASLIDRYWVDDRTYDHIALDAAEAADVASHLGQERFSQFATAYSRMEVLETVNHREASDWASLRAFRRSGGPVADAEKDRLLEAIEALRHDDAVMWLGSTRKVPQIRQFGQLDRARVDGFLADARDHYGSCVLDYATALRQNHGTRM